MNQDTENSSEGTEAFDPQVRSDDSHDVLESSNLGIIKIHNDVVASIVMQAAKGVTGVYAIVGGSGLFGKKAPSSGVEVLEDESDAYRIKIKVVLEFGVELAKTAVEIQHTVRDKVQTMTDKRVATVDVFIDDVKMPNDGSEPVETEN